MNPVGQRKCVHCKQFFVPDVRQRARQCYCAQPECRRESKAASQRRWLGRPENRDYFRGPDNVERVRAWRAANPSRPSRRRRPHREQEASPVVLQEMMDMQLFPVQQSTSPDGEVVLQETWKTQPPLLLGLIAHMTGSVLQEDMESVMRRLITRGQA
jgi:hypothetical protein